VSSLRSWLQRRHRRTLTWYGARFRRLPRPERAAIGLFCDCEGHHAGPAAGEHADRGLDLLLRLLDEHGLRITFNVVAELCRTHPQRIRRLAGAGHEIACHGWRHERPRGLAAPALDEMLKNAALCFADLGLRPAGFRSPRSDWSVPLLRALMAHGYRWNAERDPAAAPYHVVGGLVRIPVATDDWDLVADPAALPRLMLKWRQRVDHALARRRVVCIGLHEWLLGAHAGYAAALGELLSALRADGLPLILPLGELASSS
jgi:peptidoglycan/xylan/chitin deacetylase (PgdA/CDA1 family)